MSQAYTLPHTKHTVGKQPGLEQCWLDGALNKMCMLAGGMAHCTPNTGVLTSDPRLVSQAQPVPFLTYDEATELAFFGATVLHPSAMQPAFQCGGLGVRVKNSYNRYAETTPPTLTGAFCAVCLQLHQW